MLLLKAMLYNMKRQLKWDIEQKVAGEGHVLQEEKAVILDTAQLGYT